MIKHWLYPATKIMKFYWIWNWSFWHPYNLIDKKGSDLHFKKDDLFQVVQSNSEKYSYGNIYTREILI